MEEQKQPGIKLFVNWTNEDFTGFWDNIPHLIKAGQTIYLEDWKADHFAKHLTDREMNKCNIPTDSPKRPDFVVKCFGVNITLSPDVPASVTIINKNEELKQGIVAGEVPVADTEIVKAEVPKTTNIDELKRVVKEAKKAFAIAEREAKKKAREEAKKLKTEPIKTEELKENKEFEGLQS